MFRNFFVIAGRKIWRSKLFASINVMGLSLGIASFVLIDLYVRYEKRFDDFRSPQVYRVAQYGYQDNAEIGKSAQWVPALAPALKNDLPEVADAARLAHTGPFMADPVMQADEKIFRESKIYYADSSFLELFSYEMIAGSAATALALPDQVTLSQSAAKRYFGNEDPMGQMMLFHRGENGISTLKVTGVFKDVPANSHLHTEFLISFKSLEFYESLTTDWGWGNFYTYVKLAPHTEAAAVEAKFPTLLKKYVPYLADDTQDGYTVKLTLQPVQNIHLDSKLWGESEANGDRRTINFLAIVAFFIMVIAWVNYINFAIAKSAESIKEISIRKISGSNLWQLIGQLMAESAMVNLLAILISVVILEITLPLLKSILSLPEALALGQKEVWTILLLFVIGTLASGLYPAYAISSLKPLAVLKTKGSRLFNISLNRSLIIFQFTASMILMISTVTIYRQLDYMINQYTGFDLEQTLIVKGPAIKDSTYHTHQDFFRHAIVQLPGVSAMAMASSIPGEQVHWGRGYSKASDPQKSIGANIVAVDENYFPLFKATFVAGANFSDGSMTNQHTIVFNETAVRELGYTNPADIINETIIWHESGNLQVPKKVIGVVKDFNQTSFRNAVGPMVFALKKYLAAPWAGEYYVFKIPSNNIDASITDIQQVWKKVFTDNPFDYFFLDDYFFNQYKSDQRFGRVFAAFSVLAMIIASMGLFGVSSYLILLRTKEIGVRKVLGSSSAGVVQLLTRDFMWWVLIAFVLACPIAAYLMNQWLQEFAFKIALSPWIFIVAGASCMALALITVTWKSWRMANINPAEALKNE
ncbi:MAG TPA: ABC transporter permease [Chryseolinea sp.]|nr:ABC transporter permease [Chryseolinea sp.]